jgi:hypothetical protein
MKLSAEVIFDNLPAGWHAQMLGTPSTALSLGRPELYENGMREFRADHLYVLAEERLPKRIRVSPRAVIVCVGQGRRTRYFAERCSVILIPDAEFYAVFNAVQRTYDRHDAWEAALSEIINDDADIDAMLERSGELFGNPLTVIDEQFRFLGQWRREEASDRQTLAALETSAVLNPEAFASYISERDLSMDVAEPFVLELLGTKTLNANLLDRGTYLGCLTVYCEDRDFTASDILLAGHLADMLVRALRRRSTMPDTDDPSERRILMDLVEEVPLDGRERAMLDARGTDRTFVCIRIRLSNRLSKLPIGYVCTMAEGAFPHGIAFEHHHTSVVVFANVDELLDETGSYHDELLRRLHPFVRSLQAKAGISDPMHDLSQARLFFLQASTTLENGSLIHPDQSIYAYQDYALVGMVVNALGDMPVEMLFSEGFRRLVEHDRESQASYLDTLRVLLDCNMSITKASRMLYVHRSTLLERIARIKRDLDEDLDDPDVRLRLQLVLKALSIRDTMGER